MIPSLPFDMYVETWKHLEQLLIWWWCHQSGQRAIWRRRGWRRTSNLLMSPTAGGRHPELPVRLFMVIPRISCLESKTWSNLTAAHLGPCWGKENEERENEGRLRPGHKCCHLRHQSFFLLPPTVFKGDQSSLEHIDDPALSGQLNSLWTKLFPQLLPVSLAWPSCVPFKETWLGLT